MIKVWSRVLPCGASLTISLTHISRRPLLTRLTVPIRIFPYWAIMPETLECEKTCLKLGEVEFRKKCPNPDDYCDLEAHGEPQIIDFADLSPRWSRTIEFPRGKVDIKLAAAPPYPSTDPRHSIDWAENTGASKGGHQSRCPSYP